MLKRNLCIIAVICLLALLFAGVFWYEAEMNMDLRAAEVGTSGDDFACFTYDSRGGILKGYRSESDGVWYLFVTSSQSVRDVKIYYIGSIVEASVGRINGVKGTVSGAFEESGDSVELTCVDGTVCTVVVMQSSLPSVYIDLEGTTLEEIHADQETKYEGNSIYITDPDGVYTMNAEACVQIKGRGNSSWREYEKRGYQIKFSKDTSVMGMDPAKKWVLLANAGDDSLMRNQLVSHMAGMLDMDYAASFEFADLWIEGEYRGTYLIGEKVEINSFRLDLNNIQGALFEHEEGENTNTWFYEEEEYWFLNEVLDKHFVLKDIVIEDEGIIADAITDFDSAVTELTQYLYTTPSDQVTLEKLSDMIDVDSFAKYYLINEYTLNRESYATSFYWYKDGPDDVLHMGPVWDFDTCMGNDGEDYTESYGEKHVLFRYLLAVPEFYRRTMELLEQYRDVFSSMAGDADVIRAEIASSAEMNFCRWDILGTVNPKGRIRFHDTFDEAVDAVMEWLRGRENAFEVVRCNVVTSVVSEDCCEMEIAYRDDVEHYMVNFAVWSDEGGQDDLLWYPAEQGADGVWRSTVDLKKHNSAGKYRIDAYADGVAAADATGVCYVETATADKYPLKATMAEDCSTMTIRLEDPQRQLTNVRFAVWGANIGQETTLQWLMAQQEEEDLWTLTVPMCLFGVEIPEHFVVHAYGFEGTEDIFLNEALVYAGEITHHEYADGSCIRCGAAQ